MPSYNKKGSRLIDFVFRFYSNHCLNFDWLLRSQCCAGSSGRLVGRVPVAVLNNWVGAGMKGQLFRGTMSKHFRCTSVVRMLVLCVLQLCACVLVCLADSGRIQVISLYWVLIGRAQTVVLAHIPCFGVSPCLCATKFSRPPSPCDWAWVGDLAYC